MARLRDLMVASIALMVLSPLLLILAILVRLDSPGGALYRQERVGLRGKTFSIHKFRTMHVGLSGPAVTHFGDARVTRLGRWLRTAKLDELPQLIDILQGSMSLVGPRPEVPRYADLWPAEAWPIILSVRPGLTDPVTLSLRNEELLLASSSDPERTYVDLLLPAKARAYVSYVQGRTFLGDIRVVLATFKALVRPGASLNLVEEGRLQ